VTPVAAAANCSTTTCYNPTASSSTTARLPEEVLFDASAPTSLPVRRA
jgi:hypothetical protein